VSGDGLLAAPSPVALLGILRGRYSDTADEPRAGTGARALRGILDTESTPPGLMREELRLWDFGAPVSLPAGWRPDPGAP
jgi:hypothetical protein